MRVSTVLAVPLLLAVFGLAACDQNKQQATQPSDSGQQTGAMPPGSTGGSAGRSTTGGTAGSGADSSAPGSSAPAPTSPNTGAPSGQQTR